MNLVPFQTLQELADRKQASEVIEWLREHNWVFEVSFSGRPKVDIEEYRRHMIGGPETQEHHSPDLSWFHGKKTA